MVAAAAPLALTGPAAAAACSGSSGVTVVVDFKQLGGGIRQECASTGGQSAAAVFESVGVRLTQPVRQPGFVCRVDGVPTSDPCINASPGNAYWGLFWSDGASGEWVYATSGAYSLTVPEGGYVAFAWQGQSERALPGVAASPRERPSQPSTSATPSAEPTRTSSAQPTRTPTAQPTRTSSAQPTQPTQPASSPTTRASDRGTPGSGSTGSTEGTRSSDPSASIDGSASSSASSPASSSAESSGAASTSPTASESTEGAAPTDPSDPTASDSATGGDPTDPATSPDVAATDRGTDVAPGEPAGGALPSWVPVTAVVVLGLAGVVLAVLRRRGVGAP